MEQACQFFRMRFGEIVYTISSTQPESNTQLCLHKNHFGFLLALCRSLTAMKNIYEVLREKETALARLRTEVEALRFVAPLLADRSAGPGDDQSVHQPDLAWAPVLQKNKWPLKVGDPAPSYSDS
jgi:hypothetical protein